MPDFTIDIGFTIPIHHFRNYSAPTLEDACRAALEDENWTEQKEAYQEAGLTMIFGIWNGRDNDYLTPPVPIPSQFREHQQRKIDHFETLLGVLKLLLQEESLTAAKLAFWRQRAEHAIAKAEAIMASAPDPR